MKMQTLKPLIISSFGGIQDSAKRIANGAFRDLDKSNLYFAYVVNGWGELSAFGSSNEPYKDYVQRLHAKDRVRALIVDTMLLGYSYRHAIMLLAEDSVQYSNALTEENQKVCGAPWLKNINTSEPSEMYDTRYAFTHDGFLSATEARLACLLRAPLAKFFKAKNWVTDLEASTNHAFEKEAE